MQTNGVKEESKGEDRRTIGEKRNRKRNRNRKRYRNRNRKRNQ